MNLRSSASDSYPNPFSSWHACSTAAATGGGSGAVVAGGGGGGFFLLSVVVAAAPFVVAPLFFAGRKGERTNHSFFILAKYIDLVLLHRPAP